MMSLCQAIDALIAKMSLMGATSSPFTFAWGSYFVETTLSYESSFAPTGYGEYEPCPPHLLGYDRTFVTYSDVATGTVVLYRPVVDNCYNPLKEDGKFVPDMHQDTAIFEDVHVIKRVSDRYIDSHIYPPSPAEPIPYRALREVVTSYYILYDYELYSESVRAEGDEYGTWLNYDGYMRELLLDFSVYNYYQDFDDYPQYFEGKDGTQCLLPRDYDSVQWIPIWSSGWRYNIVVPRGFNERDTNGVTSLFPSL